MIERYFDKTFAIQRLRASTAGRYVDGFAAALESAGYTRWVIRERVRAAGHLGKWADAHGMPLIALNEKALEGFEDHLRRCRCFRRNQGVFGPAPVGARMFLRYLRELGTVPRPSVAMPTLNPILACFRTWMQNHRGAMTSTLDLYTRALTELVEVVGDDPTQYTAAKLRTFVVDRGSHWGRGKAKTYVAATRSFIRYLIVEGRCQAGLDRAVPTVAHFRLSTLPRYIAAADVERLIATCDDATPQGSRDRAVLMLLSRLALRAGDVAGLRLDDIDWEGASLRVSGKGRRAMLLPLPQDVGDALAAYIEHGRAACSEPQVFLRLKAPHLPFRTYMAVSNIVATAIRRAGIAAPSFGAHLLRHSAATSMLRADATLDSIAAILRHRSRETTLHYAKVDVKRLEAVAQTWPTGGASC